jgi:DNA-binding MarR family transcriptional regulator
MIDNILPFMSRSAPASRPTDLGIDAAEAARLGPDRTARLRLVRVVLVLSSHLRTAIDRQLAPDGLTAQQAAVVTVVQSVGAPSLREVARALSTTPQNVRQLVAALVRKGFIRVRDDREDGRVKRLVATPRCARYWAARDDRDHAELLALLDGLTREEVEATVERLGRVLDRALDVGSAAEAEAERQS